MPTKHEAEIAKNYLTEEEVDMLNRIVNLYLDFAELQAKSRIADVYEGLDQETRWFPDSIRQRTSDTRRDNISRGGEAKANTEYDRFRERTQYQLSPVEIHFLEAFEVEQKNSKGNNLQLFPFDT